MILTRTLDELDGKQVGFNQPGPQPPLEEVPPPIQPSGVCCCDLEESKIDVDANANANDDANAWMRFRGQRGLG